MQRRPQRAVLEAAVIAAVVSGLPSTVHALASTRSLPSTVDYVRDATTRIGVLVPPFRTGLGRGVAAHLAISVLAAEALARTLPRRRSAVWGSVAGLAMGVVNSGLIGRRIPALAELPVAPQLADNVAFGVIFGATVDRRSRSDRRSRLRG